MPIAWLASYPKSGNTWVRFILYHCLFGEPPESIDINRRIPDIHRPVPGDALQTGGPHDSLFVKTHYELTASHPELTRTDRALHIIRDPRDVLLSALNYRRLNGVTPEQLPDRAYAEQFIRAGGDATWLKQKMGTWASHAASWAGADAFDVMTIRYEDLKRDAHETMRPVIEFLGLDVGDDALGRAVEATAFDRLRAIEIREKTGTKKKDGLFMGDTRTTRKGVFFMNKGRSGQSLDEAIGPGLDAMLAEGWGEALARYGYHRPPA